MPHRGSLRASDDDRERTVERLHTAATEGRLAAEELEQRVSVALKARTYGELSATVADLPGPRRERRAPAERRSAGRWAVSTVSHNPMLLLFAIPVIAVTAAMVLLATVMWMVLMVVVLVLGGRRRVGSPPWVHARRHLLDGRRRGPGGYWA
jgi:Domain of unknown function (DUF1707)